MLNIATGYSYNTLSCSELNREHVGEGFRSLRHIHTPLLACKSKKNQKSDMDIDVTETMLSPSKMHSYQSYTYKIQLCIRGKVPIYAHLRGKQLWFQTKRIRGNR